MVIKYTISPYPALSEDMVAKVYEAQAPTAVVATILVPLPHTSPVVVTFNGLDKVVHIVRLFTASGTLLHDYNVEPKSDLITVFDPIRFKIGDGQPLTPAVGDVTYLNPLLIGLTENDFVIFRAGYGALYPNVNVQYDSIINSSFHLINGDVFGIDEEFTLMMNPRVSTQVVNDSVVGKWFGGFVDVASDIGYLAAHLRKLVRFSGSPTYEFGALDAIPIGYGFCFQHFGTADGTAIVKFSNAPLKWSNTTRATMNIPKYTEAMFVFDGTYWHVVYLSDSRWVNNATGLPGSIIALGDFYVGNAPAASDVLYTISHNLNIVGDYRVFFSVTGTAATAGRDDDTQLAWYHHPTDKSNKFYLEVGIPAGSVGHDITINWLIIKF